MVYMTALLNLAAIGLFIVVASALARLLFWIEDRQDRRREALEAAARHPSAVGRCRCGWYTLHRTGQYLGVGGDEAHSAGWCGPIEEFIPPGR